MNLLRSEKSLAGLTGLFFILVFVFYPLFVFADTTSVLRPIGDGTNDDSADWENSTGSTCNTVDCYLEVDETSGGFCTDSDGDTSYIETNSKVSQTFAIDESMIPASSTITQIDVTVCAVQGQSGAKIQTRICDNGSCTNNSNISLGTVYEETTQSHIGLSIVTDSNTQIEIGVNSNANKIARVSNISAIITYDPPEPDPSDPSVGSAVRYPIKGGGATQKFVSLSGQAYPGGNVSVLKRNVNEKFYSLAEEGELIIHSDGKFEFNLVDVQWDNWFFAVVAEDLNGIKSSLIPFNINFFVDDSLVVKDIFLPPTLNFASKFVSKGKELILSGYGAADNIVKFFVGDDEVGEVKTNDTGFYKFSTSTNNFDFGEHTLSAFQINQAGIKSNLSKKHTFTVFELYLPEADFNQDNIVDIRDWSIFLFNWGLGEKDKEVNIDMDKNGLVNIRDFSIFLKYFSI